MEGPGRAPKLAPRLFVACLCADWCGTCRSYRDSFDAVSARFSAVEFAWVDVEDEPELADAIEVENFPTLVIQFESLVLFCGPVLPHASLLERMLESFAGRPESEHAAYASGTSERKAWQVHAGLRERIRRARA